jgi:AcrR family transcriptional regulator
MSVHSAMQRGETGLVAEPTAKREAILAAALELFSDRSFDGTPVPRVAERAGVGAGTIYRYFRSKEDLVNAVYLRCQRDLRAALVSGVPRSLSPRQEFRWLWCGLWEFATHRPRAFRFLESHHHAGYLDQASREAGAALEAPLTDFVLRAQAAGAVRPLPPELLVSMLLGAFVGLFKAAETGRLVLSPEVLACSEEAAWRTLGG